MELYQSGLTQECLELLETIWVYHIGFGSWFLLSLVLYVFQEGDVSEKDLLAITRAFSLAFTKKTCDSTVFHLLLRGSDTLKPFVHSKEYMNATEAIVDCLTRGKLQEAWLISRCLSEEELWVILEKLIKPEKEYAFQTVKELRICRRESLALAFILVSLDDILWIGSQQAVENKLPVEVSQAMDTWNSEKSLRKRRAIKPKPEALIYLTGRSEQTAYVSSEPDIQGRLLESLQMSEYWQGVLEGFMVSEKWKSQRHKELFFETYFPEDIPDEWSLADREKSHGRGLGKTLEQGRQRFIQLTLQHSKSIELWNSTFPSAYTCSMDWDSLYCDRPEIAFPMKPMSKVFVL